MGVLHQKTFIKIKYDQLNPVLWIRNDFFSDPIPDPAFQRVPDPIPDPDPDPTPDPDPV